MKYGFELKVKQKNLRGNNFPLSFLSRNQK